MRIDILYPSPEDLLQATQTEKPVEPTYAKINGNVVHKLTVGKLGLTYDVQASRHTKVSVVWTDDYDVTRVRLYPNPLVQTRLNKRHTKITLTVEGEYTESIVRL